MKHELSRGIGAVVLNRDNKVLLLFRADHKNWEFPRGKKMPGETDEETVQRELFEETGIEAYEVLPGFSEGVTYSFPFEDKMIYREVTYYLVRTAQPAKTSKEHSDFTWTDLVTAEGMMKFENYRRVIRRVREYLADKGSAK